MDDPDRIEQYGSWLAWWMDSAPEQRSRAVWRDATGRACVTEHDVLRARAEGTFPLVRIAPSLDRPLAEAAAAHAALAEALAAVPWPTTPPGLAEAMASIARCLAAPTASAPPTSREPLPGEALVVIVQAPTPEILSAPMMR